MNVHLFSHACDIKTNKLTPSASNKTLFLEQISFATTRAAPGRHCLFTARCFKLCPQFEKVVKCLFTVHEKMLLMDKNTLSRPRPPWTRSAVLTATNLTASTPFPVYYFQNKRIHFLRSCCVRIKAPHDVQLMILYNSNKKSWLPMVLIAIKTFGFFKRIFLVFRS